MNYVNNKKYSSIIGVILIVNILLLNCTGMDQQKSNVTQNSLSEERVSGNFLEIGTNIKEEDNEFLESKSVDIMFLVDMSGSVVGNAESSDKCPQGSKPVHKEFLSYLINLLAELPENNSNQLNLSVGRFGESYDTVFPMMPADMINASKEYENLRTFLDYENVDDDATHYGDALSKGNRILQEYSKNKVDQKVIILLTDGLGLDVLDVEKALASIPFDTQIYIAPVCPNYKDISFWAKHRIPSLGNSPSDWLKNIFDLPFMRSALPDSSGWLKGPERKEIEIDGSANRVTFEYRPFGSNPSLFTARVSDDLQTDSLSDGLADFHQTPTKLCAPHKYYLEAKNVSDQGFWWVSTIARPAIDSVQIIQETAGVNTQEISISATISTNGDILSDFESWKNCYDTVDLTFYDSKGQEISNLNIVEQPCNTDKSLYLCPSNNKNTLTKTWTWFPSHFDTPTTISAVGNYKDNFTGILVKSVQKDITISFQPKISDSRFMLKSNLFKPNIDKIYYEFQTEFDVKTPDIFLERSDNSAPLPNLCPNLNGLWNQKYVHFVPINVINKEFSSRVAVNKKQDKGQYELEINESAIDVCGFDTVIFSWQTQNTSMTLASTWSCDLKSAVCIPLEHVQK